jgi:hypothetical protein
MASALIRAMHGNAIRCDARATEMLKVENVECIAVVMRGPHLNEIALTIVSCVAAHQARWATLQRATRPL